MKYLIYCTLLITLAGCNSQGVRYTEGAEFDWMPHPVVWEQNIRTCRSQTTCNAADLFEH